MTVRDAGGANHPIVPHGLSPLCCCLWPWGCQPALGLGAAISLRPHLSGILLAGSGPSILGSLGREVRALERSGVHVADGRALPLSRLAVGETAQTRIRAATFLRTARMGEVKYGFGSWQHHPEEGPRTSGWILGSLLPRPALAPRRSGQPM